jgi:hypothetical protein
VFRYLFLALYVAVAAVFSGALVLGVTSGLTQLRAPKATPRSSTEQCVAAAGKLRAELVDRLAAFSSARSAALEGRDFGLWAVRFRGRLAAETARCNPPMDEDPGKADSVQEAFVSLRRALDLSEIHATHWARHLGPALDHAAEALEQAKRIAP